MNQPIHAPEDVDASDVFFAQPSLNHPILERSLIERAVAETCVSGDALVVRADLRTDRSGRYYVAMTLQCAGQARVEARWWQFPYAPTGCPAQGEVYRITASINIFQGERQLRIISAEYVPGADLRPFVKTARRPLSQLLDEYQDICSRLDEQMRALVQTVLSDNVFHDFCEWPAAQYRHGAVRHGLLAHSLRVAVLVQQLADAYGVDGLPYDRSLAITAALLHDIGKLRTLPEIAGAAFPESASYFDHVTLGILAVQDAANRLDPPIPADRFKGLLHAILAHHGRQEWGATCEPHSAEAWLVHLADLAESRLWAYSNEECLPSDE